MGNGCNKIFPVGDKNLYLSSLIDLHYNFILGYQISEGHDVQLVEDTLLSALKTRKIAKGIILHFDQGMPYRLNRWDELMDEHKQNYSKHIKEGYSTG